MAVSSRFGSSTPLTPTPEVVWAQGEKNCHRGMEPRFLSRPPVTKYFSFPLSVQFHQRSIPIHSPTTHTIQCFSPSTSVFPCQYHSTNAPSPFIHLPPTLYNVSLPVLLFSPSVSFLHCCMLICILIRLIRRTRERNVKTPIVHCAQCTVLCDIERHRTLQYFRYVYLPLCLASVYPSHSRQTICQLSCTLK